MKRLSIFLLALAIAVVTARSLWSADDKQHTGPKRVRPPVWERTGAGDLFFTDLFKEVLSGTRPSDFSKPLGPVSPGGTAKTPGPSGGGTSGGSEYAWSGIISPTTVEDEVKKIKAVIDGEQDLETPSGFKGRGYSKARRHFSVLALMFAVAAEYDGDVRWKDDAPLARDLCAQAARVCKAGTDQSFQFVKARKQDLQDLVGGAKLQADGKSAEQKANWEAEGVCHRAPLMQRIEASHQRYLSPWTASKAEFDEHLEEILHEAEIVAAVSEALKQEGMQDGDDPDYAAYADKMKNAALDIVSAVKTSDAEAARKGAGAIGQACSECHENYRG